MVIILLVHTVTPAKLHTVMGVELTRFSRAEPGARISAAGTPASVHSAVRILGRCVELGYFLADEHSEDCLRKGYRKETCSLAAGLATVLLRKGKEISNFARSLLLGKNSPQTL